MKKKLTAMLCTVVLLFCLLSQTAFAAGSIEGVDYTRFQGTGNRVTLTLGELVFEGQLSRGSMLSQSEQDKIIKQTMNDLKITSGMLINAKSMLDAAHSLEGFNIKDVGNAALKLAGVDNYIDLYNHVMGSKDKTSAQIAADIAKGQLTDFAEDGLENVLTQGGNVALKGAGKYAFKLLFLLPDLTEIGLDALTKYENIKETCAKALERQLLLDSFYDECNNRIAAASGDCGAWEIRFDKKNTQTYNCTFWGISGVMMEASLSGVLEQVSEIDDASGMYRGTLWLDIEGVDMDNSFDAQITSAYPFTTTWAAASAMKSHSEEKEKTILQRQIQGEISVMITGGSGTQVSDVSGSLTSGGDETTFMFDHKFTGSTTLPLKGTVTRWWHYTASAPEVFTETCDDGSSMTLPFPSGIGTVWKPLESKPYITVYK